jgi:osmotically inducible protein OsmC
MIAPRYHTAWKLWLSLILGEAQLKAEHMETRAEVTLDKVADGFAITRFI